MRVRAVRKRLGGSRLKRHLSFRDPAAKFG